MESSREYAGSVGAGGSLIFNGNDGKLYALRGGGTTDFWSYDPSTNTWTLGIPLPLRVSHRLILDQSRLKSLIPWAILSVFFRTLLIQIQIGLISAMMEPFNWMGIYHRIISGYVSGIPPGTLHSGGLGKPVCSTRLLNLS